MITIKDNRELNEEVWIVTYWDKDEEPTVTPFFLMKKQQIKPIIILNQSMKDVV